MLRGHPLKGPCQEEKRILLKKVDFSDMVHNRVSASLAFAEISSRAVSVFAAPVTHQDQGPRGYSSLIDRTRVAGLKVLASAKLSNLDPIGPFPLPADQKIFGSRPCPNDSSQISWLQTNPFVVHGVGSKETLNSMNREERRSNQVLWLQTNPSTRLSAPAT